MGGKLHFPIYHANLAVTLRSHDVINSVKILAVDVSNSSALGRSDYSENEWSTP